MFVGKEKELVPVVCRHLMLPGPIMIRNRAQYRLIQRRHLIRPKVLRSKQPVGRPGANASEELSLRIRPLVLFRPGHVDGTRRNQSNQLVRINWKPLRVTAILLKISTEPVGKYTQEIVDCLAIVPSHE